MEVDERKALPLSIKLENIVDNLVAATPVAYQLKYEKPRKDYATGLFEKKEGLNKLILQNMMQGSAFLGA
jgi:hypothetical protein